MRLFSKASQYAIRTVVSALETGPLPTFSVKRTCEKAGIPEAYARKALQEMTKAGILRGVPGPRGGYALIRKPSEVSLLDIVFAVDGQYAFAECPMGLRCQAQLKDGGSLCCDVCTLPTPMCGFNLICPMHDLWKKTRQSLITYLETTTLQNVKDRLGTIPKNDRA